MESRTILILGGYGGAGLATARLLLQETAVPLILAGRDKARATEAARRLNAECSESRVDGVAVDAADQVALEAALRDCDLVTVCCPMTGIGKSVAQAAFDVGIDYVDLNVDPDRQRTLEALSDRIERAGRRFITDAGLVPGVPSVLARWTATHFDSLEELTVGALARTRDLTYGSAIDIMAATSTSSRIYEHGAWRRPSLIATRTIDFGPPFGRNGSYPADLREMRPLPEQLGLERCGSYAAGLDALANAVAATWYLLKLGRWPSGARLGAKLLVWANNRFARPPFGIAVAIEALGESAGTRKRLCVTLQHDDGYVATAIPTVACICQLLGGPVISPGVRMMGHAVDAVRFMRDLERMGIKQSVTSGVVRP